MNTRFDIQTLTRQNIASMKPYSSARDEFKGEADVYLDANENPFLNGYNRYPDPLQWKVKEKLSAIKNISKEQIFLGNGSDEAIDLLIRCFCEPGRDNIIITEPTYGMYAVCAATNNVQVKSTSLTPDFEIDLSAIHQAIDSKTNIIFLCSPNNPSGNLLDAVKIESLLEKFAGLVVVDEAYIDFTICESFINLLSKYSNLVVLQTLSKAWGLAGLRIGMCFASTEIISILNKVKYPYNINSQTQTLALAALENKKQKEQQVALLIAERETLAKSLQEIRTVEKVFPSQANFLLVRVTDAPAIYKDLMSKGIIVRDRSSILHCKNCLRITVGTPEENKRLLTTLQAI